MPARWRAAVAVTAVESMPPLRKQPSGTSLAMRSRTASSSRRLISLRQVGTSTVGSGWEGMSQYRRVAILSWVTVSACAGGSLATPRIIE